MKSVTASTLTVKYLYSCLNLVPIVTIKTLFRLPAYIKRMRWRQGCIPLPFSNR